jgi:hypothetical protein
MNFEKDVKEHHNKLKEKIEHLQKTNLFDKTLVKDIHIFFFYVINQKLEQYKRIDVSIPNSILSKDLLLSNILKNKKEDGRKFIVTGIYKYHFNEPNLSEFIDHNVLSNFLSTFQKVEDIPYEKSIDIFQDYSSLFIVLQNEKPIQTRRQTEQKKNKTIRKV